MYVSDGPTYRQTRGHGKETGTEIHLKVKTHHYFSHDDGDDDDVNNNNNNNNNTETEKVR